MPVLRKIKTEYADEKCPQCGKGWMRPSGIVQPTTPPQYEHSCTNCGHKQTYGIRYPYIIS
jgi:predicted RNA-binding Zn-ribbon protein involved in translation (DUF1610 family)